MNQILTGYCFVIVQDKEIVTGGTIGECTDNHYLVMFEGPAPYWTVLNTAALAQMTLFPTKDHRQHFIDRYLAMQNANAPLPPTQDDPELTGQDAEGNEVTARPVTVDEGEGTEDPAVA